MPRVPEEVHVRLVLDDGQVEAVRKIRRLLSDLSDALSVFAPDDSDTGQPDTFLPRLSDPDAPKADLSGRLSAVRLRPEHGMDTGQVVREDDVQGICGQELPEPWVQGVRWCPRPPGHEEDCGHYGLRGM